MTQVSAGNSGSSNELTQDGLLLTDDGKRGSLLQKPKLWGLDFFEKGVKCRVLKVIGWVLSWIVLLPVWMTYCKKGARKVAKDSTGGNPKFSGPGHVLGSKGKSGKDVSGAKAQVGSKDSLSDIEHPGTDDHLGDEDVSGDEDGAGTKHHLSDGKEVPGAKAQLNGEEPLGDEDVSGDSGDQSGDDSLSGQGVSVDEGPSALQAPIPELGGVSASKSVLEDPKEKFVQRLRKQFPSELLERPEGFKSSFITFVDEELEKDSSEVGFESCHEGLQGLLLERVRRLSQAEKGAKTKYQSDQFSKEAFQQISLHYDAERLRVGNEHDAAEVYLNEKEAEIEEAKEAAEIERKQQALKTIEQRLVVKVFNKGDLLARLEKEKSEGAFSSTENINERVRKESEILASQDRFRKQQTASFRALIQKEGLGEEIAQKVERWNAGMEAFQEARYNCIYWKLQEYRQGIVKVEREQEAKQTAAEAKQQATLLKRRAERQQLEAARLARVKSREAKVRQEDRAVVSDGQKAQEAKQAEAEAKQQATLLKRRAQRQQLEAERLARKEKRVTDLKEKYGSEVVMADWEGLVQVKLEAGDLNTVVEVHDRQRALVQEIQSAPKEILAEYEDVKAAATKGGILDRVQGDIDAFFERKLKKFGDDAQSAKQVLVERLKVLRGKDEQ